MSPSPSLPSRIGKDTFESRSPRAFTGKVNADKSRLDTFSFSESSNDSEFAGGLCKRRAEHRCTDALYRATEPGRSVRVRC